ncbi:MAG TPA: M28 family peptidase [Candidatus Binatia bacterium]|nr:M28 family peptidase [Candidatus Binatia bacterium]
MRVGWSFLLSVLLASSAAVAGPSEVDRVAGTARQGVRSIVKRLSDAVFAGRDNNTPESDRVQRLLIGKLRRIGTGLDTTATGDDAFRQPFEQSGQVGTNLLAVIRGRELPDEYVVVGAHYDHLDSRSMPSGSCSIRNAPGGVICPGATDNAAGVGAVLGLGRALGKLAQPPRRSVVLALWDAEEDGLLGSLYYVRHPLVPLSKTVAYVNLDIQGANLLPSLRRVSFSVGAETGGSALGAFVTDAVAAEGLDTTPVSFIFGQLRSDYANFVRVGKVATVFFSDSTGGCYHTTGDTFDVVDTRKLAVQTRIAFRTTVALADTLAPPPFRGENPAAATYADALALSHVFATAQSDLPLFSPADQVIVQQLQSDVAAVVAAGPDAFGPAQVGALLTAAAQGINALTRLPCQRF